MGGTQLTVPNSMSSSYDRDDSSDEADDQPVVDGSDVTEETTPQDLSNIKRILDQCHVLYKCKVDQHNRKVRIESLFCNRPVGAFLFKILNYSLHMKKKKPHHH